MHAVSYFNLTCRSSTPQPMSTAPRTSDGLAKSTFTIARVSTVKLLDLMLRFCLVTADVFLVNPAVAGKHGDRHHDACNSKMCNGHQFCIMLVSRQEVMPYLDAHCCLPDDKLPRWKHRERLQGSPKSSAAVLAETLQNMCAYLQCRTAPPLLQCVHLHNAGVDAWKATESSAHGHTPPHSKCIILSFPCPAASCAHPGPVRCPISSYGCAA